MPGHLAIRLLGGFRVAADDRAVREGAWRLRKARSLLKLLALVPGHALHREQLLELLWPDRGRDSAANNLRQALHVARRAIESLGLDGADALATQRGRIALAPPGGMTIDVVEFEAAAASALAERSTAALRRAVDCYGGELLPEDRYEPWAHARREGLRDRYVVLAVELARAYERGRDVAAAIGALQVAVSEDPLHEAAQRELMSMYAQAGQRQRALAQYHALREALRAEVADEPDAETRALYRSILTRQAPSWRGGDESPRPVVRRPGGDERGTLPRPLTSFVGRERELAELDALLRRPATRLLTLTGPGGAGKTRLALELTARRPREHARGEWLVELAPIADERAVAPAIAAAIGAETPASRPVEDSLVAHIGDASLLLVLDNCEHVVGVCAALAERLLSACPRLTVLATSRESLRIAGEHEWRVASLSLPGPNGVAPSEAERFEAVRLFCERACAARPGFALDAANVAQVVAICRHVAGIPLALELAAARVGVLAVAEIAERLEGSLAVLEGGSRTALTRQQTLTGALDWSHELLDEPERTLFRRLGAFAGAATLQSVEQVCGGHGFAHEAVLGTLARLVDKSLVVVDAGAGASRFRLLAPIRQYALTRLEAAGELEALRERHRAHYLEVAERAHGALLAPDSQLTLAALDADHDDLQAALEEALRSSPQVALRLAHALWRSWFQHGRLVEGERWLQAALDAAPEPSALRVRALLARSVVAGRRGLHPLARASAAEALAVAERIGDERGAVQALLHAGTLAWVGSELDVAEAHVERARELAERQGDPALEVSVLVTRAGLASSRGRFDRVDALLDGALDRVHALPAGHACFLPVALGLVLEPRDDGPGRMHNEDTLAPWRRVRAEQAIGHVLLSRAASARWRGELATARGLLEEALERFRDLHDAGGIALALAHLGATLRDHGELDTARELIEESLALRERRGEHGGAGIARNALALLHARAGEHARAHELLGRSQAEFTAAGDAVGICATLADTGYAALDAGNLPRARAVLERALTMATDVFGWLTGAAWLSLALAAEAHAAGDMPREHALIEHARDLFARNADALGATACQRAAAHTGSTPERPPAA